MRTTDADRVIGVEKMGAPLGELVAEEVDDTRVPSLTGPMTAETAMAELDDDALNDADHPGTPAGFGCPNCHGSLFTITEGGMERYRCRVGHAWSPEALMEELTQAVDGALWTAMRALAEQAALSRRMEQGAEERGHHGNAAVFRRRHDESQQALEQLRRLLDRGELSSGALLDDGTEG